MIYAGMVILELHTRPKPWSTNDARTMIGPVQNQHAQPWKEATRLAMRDYRISTKAPADHVFPYGVVQVTIPFDQARDRDPHNYCGTVLKAVIDGLKDDRIPVKGKGMVLRSRGLWPDDTPEYVGHREPLLVVDKTGKVRPTVTIVFHEDGVLT